MTRGRLLFAVVLLAAMGAAPDRARAGASAPWFALSGGVSDSAAADAGLADMPAIDDRLEPSTLAAGLSGIDNGEFFVAPASEIAGARELGHTAVFGASGLASGAFGEDGSDVLGMPASAVTVDSTRVLSLPADFYAVTSALALEVAGDLVVPLSEADRTAASSVEDGDLLARDAVPALAVLALGAAGFLLLAILRRHHRIVLARRVKRSVARSRRPLRPQ
ncbi:MAG TPA: hypothetical protein VNV18_09085 [Stellaceae bacterium]|jgi:hypothetical protein|nr:hypothetical protein [Stellaceae bacterium]